MLAAGMAAAWFAAGSTGLVAHPLQHALTWLALAVALVAAWPQNARSFGTWAILASGAIVGLLFTASAIPTLNVLAVAVVLAAIAQVSHNLTARVALIAALGATVLGCFRFASHLDSDGLARCRRARMDVGPTGRLVGGLSLGSRRNVRRDRLSGSHLRDLHSLDHLHALRPVAAARSGRAAAIVLGHFVYLVVLAYSEKLLALLPAVVVPPKSDINHVGIWTWTNGLRTLIPWNMPLVAMFIDVAIVAAMVGSSPWLPVIEIDPEKLKRQKAREEKEEVPGSVLAKDMLFRFGPPLLAIAAALLAALAVNKSDLKGKTIVAYDQGYLNWLKPEYDSPIDGRYGMLPAFVESLGGKFEHSKDLSETRPCRGRCPAADPSRSAVAEGNARPGVGLCSRRRIAAVGGRAGDPRRRLVEQFQRSVGAVGDGGSFRHGRVRNPAIGSNRTMSWRIPPRRASTICGTGSASSWVLRSARTGPPGRCWSGDGDGAIRAAMRRPAASRTTPPANRLGDLVLAAEQKVGRGRVFVLGDTSPLQNDGLPNAFPFAGRLLSYLANRPSSPQAAWRQWLALATLLAMVGLMAGRPAAWQTMLTPTVLGVSLVCCMAAGYWSGRVLPDGRSIASGSNNSPISTPRTWRPTRAIRRRNAARTTASPSSSER